MLPRSFRIIDIDDVFGYASDEEFAQYFLEVPNPYELAKVYRWADVRDVGSWRVMEKVGMIREGHFRRHGVMDGKRVDFYYYGVLREEWAN